MEPGDGEVYDVFDDSTFEDSCYRCTIEPENAEISSVESIGVDKGGVIGQGGTLPYLDHLNNKFISHIKALEFKIYVRPTIGSSFKLTPVVETEEEYFDEEEDEGEGVGTNIDGSEAKEEDEYKLFPDEDNIAYSALSTNSEGEVDLSLSANGKAFTKTIYFNYAPHEEEDDDVLDGGKKNDKTSETTLPTSYKLKIPSSMLEWSKPIHQSKYTYSVNNAKAAWTASNMKLRWHGGRKTSGDEEVVSFEDEGVSSPAEYNYGLSTSVQKSETTTKTDENDEKVSETTYSTEQLDYTLMKTSGSKVTKEWLKEIVTTISVELNRINRSIADLELQIKGTATVNGAGETLSNSLTALKTQLARIGTSSNYSDIQSAAANIEQLLQDIKLTYLGGDFDSGNSTNTTTDQKYYSGTELSSVYRITIVKDLLKDIDTLLSKLLEKPKLIQTFINDLKNKDTSGKTAAENINSALDAMKSVEDEKEILKTCVKDLYNYIDGHIKSYNPRNAFCPYTIETLSPFSTSTSDSNANENSSTEQESKVNPEKFSTKVNNKDISTYCFGYAIETTDMNSEDEESATSTEGLDDKIGNAINKILYSKDENLTGSVPKIYASGTFEYFADAFSKIWDACQITEDQLGSKDWKGPSGVNDSSNTVLYNKDSEKIDPDDLSSFINRYASTGFSLKAYLFGHAYRKDNSLFTASSHNQTDTTYKLIDILSTNQRQTYYDTNESKTTSSVYSLIFKDGSNSSTSGSGGGSGGNNGSGGGGYQFGDITKSVLKGLFGLFDDFFVTSAFAAAASPTPAAFEGATGSATSGAGEESSQDTNPQAGTTPQTSVEIDTPVVWLSFPSSTTLSQSYRSVMSYFLLASLGKKQGSSESNTFVECDTAFLNAKSGSNTSKTIDSRINTALKNLSNTSQWDSYSGSVKTLRDSVKIAFDAYLNSSTLISDPFAEHPEPDSSSDSSTEKSVGVEQVKLLDVIEKINSRAEFLIVLKASIDALYGEEIGAMCEDLENIPTCGTDGKADIIKYFTEKLNEAYSPDKFFKITTITETTTGTEDDQETTVTKTVEDKSGEFEALKTKLNNQITALAKDLSESEGLKKDISTISTQLNNIDTTNEKKTANTTVVTAMKFNKISNLLGLDESEVAGKTYSTDTTASIYDIYDIKLAVRSMASFIGLQAVRDSSVDENSTLKYLIENVESTQEEIIRSRIVWLLDDKFTGKIVPKLATGFNFTGLRYDLADITEDISDSTDDNLSELKLSEEATKIHRILGDKAERAIVYEESAEGGSDENVMSYMLSPSRLNTATNESGEALTSEGASNIEDKNLFYIFQSVANPDSTKASPGEGHGIESMEFQFSTEKTDEKDARPDEFISNANGIILNKDKTESGGIQFPGVGDIEIEVTPMEQPYIELPVKVGKPVREYFNNRNETKTITITPTTHDYRETKDGNQKVFTFITTLHNVEIYRIELEEVSSEEAATLSHTRRFDFSVASKDEVTGKFGSDLKFTGNIGRSKTDDVYFGIQNGDTIKMETRNFGPADANFVVETQDGKSTKHGWQGADEDETTSGAGVTAAGFIRKFFNIIRRTWAQFVSFFAPQDTKLMFADFSYPVNAVLFFGYGNGSLYKYKDWQYPDKERKYLYQGAALSRVTQDASEKFKEDTDARLYVIMYRKQPEIESAEGRSSYEALKRCASTSGNKRMLFEAETEEQLHSALQDIADDIKKFANYEAPTLLYQ